MRVILWEDIENIGEKATLITMSPGYTAKFISSTDKKLYTEVTPENYQHIIDAFKQVKNIYIDELSEVLKNTTFDELKDIAIVLGYDEIGLKSLYMNNKKGFISEIESYIRWYSLNPLQKAYSLVSSNNSYYDILIKVLAKLKISTKEIKDIDSAEDKLIDFLMERIEASLREKGLITEKSTPEEIEKILMENLTGLGQNMDNINTGSISAVASGTGAGASIIASGKIANDLNNVYQVANSAFTTAKAASEAAKTYNVIYKSAKVATYLPSLTSQVIGQSVKVGSKIALTEATATASANYVVGNAALQTAARYVAIRSALGVLNVVGTAYFIGSGLWWLFGENYKKLIPAMIMIVQLRIAQKLNDELELGL